MSVCTGKAYRHLLQTPFHSPSGCMVLRSTLKSAVLQIAHRTLFSLDSTCSAVRTTIPIRYCVGLACGWPSGQPPEYRGPAGLLQPCRVGDLILRSYALTGAPWSV